MKNMDFWDVNDLSEALFDNIDKGIVGIDDRNCVRAWNRWMTYQSGLSAEAVQGKPLTKVFPDLSTTTTESISQVFATGLPRILSPSLHTSWFPELTSNQQLVQLTPLGVPEDRIHGVMIVIMDMTGVLAYEESMKSRYKSLVDFSSDHIFLLDPGGRYIASNDRVERFGLEKGSHLVGKHYRKVYPAEAAGLYAKHLDHLIKTGDSVRFEYRMPCGGEVCYHEVILYLIKKVAGIYAVGGISRDVTEKRRAETAARQRTKEISGVYDMAFKAGASLDRSRVADAVLDVITEAIEPSMTLLFLKRGDELFPIGFRAGDLRCEGDENRVHRVGECLCGLAARDGRPVYAVDIHQDPRCTWTECKRAGLCSFAALPLVIQGRVNGVLGLGSEGSRNFEEQSRFLETLATQAGLSLENALLFEKIEQYSEALEDRVKKRTAELEEKNEELRKFNKLFVGRELRMVELKERIRILENELAAKGVGFC